MYRLSPWRQILSPLRSDSYYASPLNTLGQGHTNACYKCHDSKALFQSWQSDLPCVCTNLDPLCLSHSWRNEYAIAHGIVKAFCPPFVLPNNLIGALYKSIPLNAYSSKSGKAIAMQACYGKKISFHWLLQWNSSLLYTSSWVRLCVCN